jgi:hypothetical protein
MDNPAEEPTLKAVKNEVDDATQSKIDKFNELIIDINEQADILLSVSTGLVSANIEIQGDDVAGAGRKRGGAFSKNITSHTVPTAESFKPRYGAKYSQYDYAKTGLNTNANFVGAGRRRRKMRGGANEGEDYGDLENMLMEEVDYGDEEDSVMTPDSLDDSLAPLSQLSDLSSRSYRGREPPNSDDGSLPSDIFERVSSQKLEFKTFVEASARITANIEKAISLFNKQIKKGLSTLSRSRLIDFIGDEVAKLDEIKGTLETIEANYNRIIEAFGAYLAQEPDDESERQQHTRISRLSNDIKSKFYTLFDKFDTLYNSVKSSLSTRESSGVDVRRTGAGMTDYRGDYYGVNTSEDLARIKEMSGGARGGVPILSSIASSYHRIPTKYML